MMPFEYIETIPNADFSENTASLSITNTPNSKLILLRSLIGTLEIKHVYTDVSFNQTIDYFDLANNYVGVFALDRLANYISVDVTSEDVATAFKERKFLYKNNKFFDRLNSEFSNVLYYTNKQSYTTAFAYQYRILETVSYAFPLIYATKTEDFRGTYNLLKDFMSGNKDKGELGFFKSFLKVIFASDPVKDSSINIDILAATEELQKVFYDAFMKACPDQKIFDPADTDEPRRLSVNFLDYSSFIINLRNRFFHLFNSGQPNLQSDDIIDADYFFELVNKQTTYWLSIVLLEILKHNIVPELPGEDDDMEVEILPEPIEVEVPEIPEIESETGL